MHDNHNSFSLVILNIFNTRHDMPQPNLSTGYKLTSLKQSSVGNPCPFLKDQEQPSQNFDVLLPVWNSLSRETVSLDFSEIFPDLGSELFIFVCSVGAAAIFNLFFWRQF